MDSSNTSLLSNVTPYWWNRHWRGRDGGDDESRSLVRRALQAIMTMNDVETVNAGAVGIEVRFAVGVAQNPAELQDRADALRVFLDEMVPASRRVACGAN